MYQQCKAIAQHHLIITSFTSLHYVFTDQDTFTLETDHLKLSITRDFLLPAYIYNYICVFADVLSWLHSEWKWFKANSIKTEYSCTKHL